MTPRQVLDALRFALASGAIEVKAHGGPYPCDVQMYGSNGDSLFLKWNGADIKFTCQNGVESIYGLDDTEELSEPQRPGPNLEA